MSIIHKLTIRQLKENKRRTLVTIIGVIISVAMVTAVATLNLSYLDLMKRQTIATNGEWHVQYKEVKHDQLNAIAKDGETKKLFIANDLGFALLNGSQNEGKPYLFIKGYDQEGFHQIPIKLISGRLPQKENEVIISEEIISNAKVKYRIGDQLKVNIGERFSADEGKQLSQEDPLQTKDTYGKAEIWKKEKTETFTIVGMMERPTWEPSWSPGYTIIRYIDRNNLAKLDKVDVFVVLKKVNGLLYKHAEKLATRYHIQKIGFNNDLLHYYGVTKNDNLKTTFYLLLAIIMVIIIIGSVALIYNAFSISVSERSRHLGMLSSVGATKRQKRNSVFFEGAIIGVISIPIGIIAGILGIAITFSFINPYIKGALDVTEKLKVVVTPLSIIVACIISIITIFISTYFPARKASKISAIDAIRQTNDIKLSRKTVKTSKIIRKIFGIEAEIGLKNVKRNKRRYQATVFSLVISIVLFLSVSFFSLNVAKSYDLAQKNINFDIQVTGRNANPASYKPLTQLEYVTKSSIVEQLYLNTWINKDDLPEGLKEKVKQKKVDLENGKFPYNIALYGLDNKSFKAYTKQVGINGDNYQSSSTPSAIVIDKISYQDFDTGKFIETKSIKTKPGKVVELFSYNDKGKLDHVKNIEIAALTDQVPMGIQTSELGGLDLIVSEKTMQQILDTQKTNVAQTSLYLNSSDPMATEAAIEKAKQSNMYVYNVYHSRQSSHQLAMLMLVFAYGFIALISLISVANIFNTISTSISLRKREFAMLRSVGMTPKGFNKMIHYESAFYGIKALLYGLPISIGVMILIYFSLKRSFVYGFAFPWMNIIYVVVMIFILISLAMLYSISKIKKENIIDGLKQENI